VVCQALFIALMIVLALLSNGRCGPQLVDHMRPASSTSTIAPTAEREPTRAPSATSILIPIPSATSPSSRTDAPLAAIEVAPRDPPALAARLKGIARPIPLVVNATPPTYHLGDQEVFCVGNTDTSEQLQITATLRAMTPHLLMWVDEDCVVDQAALESSAQRFEQSIYPTNRAFFGSEWTPGVDNDVRLNTLNTRGLGRGVLGYYSSADEFSRVVNPFSNEREIFYVNLAIVEPGTEEYDSTLAHEFQHMIHWANDRNEDAWVSEGFSKLAEYLNGYTSGSCMDSYLRAPDTQLTAWALTDQPTYAHYGASFLFSLYFLERFGEDGVRRVVAEQTNGEAGFDSVMSGWHLSFEDVFADWVAANHLDETSVAEGRYGYKGIDTPSPQLSARHDRYPVCQSASVHQYGADYILLEGEGDLQVTFEGASQVKVVPNDPHSGRYQWWSNYGDESDMTLTRRFDLRGLKEATLTTWLWYDIEEGWDYAYVEVSTDGGQNWHILRGEHTTAYNPNGNAFGVGYTGRSGGQHVPTWVREEIDLSSYAGQEVLVRFEYITDDAVNHPGLCIDDIAIPQLTYSDDVEQDTGWEGVGFARTDNQLDQRFLVQVIELAERPRVRRIALDRQSKGDILIEGLGQKIEHAVLVVSGLTPVTMETGVYTYTVESLPGSR